MASRERVTALAVPEFPEGQGWLASIHCMYAVLLLFVATAIAGAGPATYALNGSFDPIPLVGGAFAQRNFSPTSWMLQGRCGRGSLSWKRPGVGRSAWSFLAYLLVSAAVSGLVGAPARAGQAGNRLPAAGGAWSG